MADRYICLICGTGILCFWLGYNAAKFANGLPLQLSMLDGLNLLSAGVLLFQGSSRRRAEKST